LINFCTKSTEVLKMQEWKMREHVAGVENAGATKYGEPSEKIL